MRPELFQEIEGVDIDPAAGVALATLIKAAKCGQIEQEAITLLHITGGGWSRRKLGKKLLPVKPALELDEREIWTQKAIEKIVELFQ